MEAGRLLNLLYLVLLLAVILLAWRWPRISHRKFNWRSLKNDKKRENHRENREK